jgi:hypothetical protein
MYPMLTIYHSPVKVEQFWGANSRTWGMAHSYQEQHSGQCWPEVHSGWKTGTATSVQVSNTLRVFFLLYEGLMEDFTNYTYNDITNTQWQSFVQAFAPWHLEPPTIHPWSEGKSSRTTWQKWRNWRMHHPNDWKPPEDASEITGFYPS